MNKFVLIPKDQYENLRRFKRVKTREHRTITISPKINPRLINQMKILMILLVVS